LVSILLASMAHVRSPMSAAVFENGWNVAIIVVGMHRSGTSALASAIEAFGFSTGQPTGLLAPDEHNRRGYFEQRAIVDLNDEILDHLGGSALEPRVLGEDWHADEFLVASVERIRLLLGEIFDDARFVVKDLGSRSCCRSGGPLWTMTWCSLISLVIPGRSRRHCAVVTAQRSK